MNLKCVFGIHCWEGCKCSRCGAIRDKDHQWDEARCKQCGKTSPEEEARFLKAIADGDCEDVETRLNAIVGLAFIKDIKGNTPLHLAAFWGHVSIAKLLISRNPNVNVFNQLGDSALHVAAERDHPNVVQLLMNHGADVNALNRRGNTLLDEAVRNDNDRVGELFVKSAEATILAAMEADPTDKCITSYSSKWDTPFGWSEWDGDHVVLKALENAKRLGSHRMAACLHRSKGNVHRMKGKLHARKAKAFADLYNAGARTQVSLFLKEGAIDHDRSAQGEYRKAQDEDIAADIEIALNAKAHENSGIQVEEIDK